MTPLKIALAVVRSNNEHRFLLIRRTVPEQSLLWTFPGGKMKTGEQPADAAFRKVYEETGVRCRILKTLGSRVDPQTGAEIHYLAAEQIYGKALCNPLREIAEVKWCSPQEALKLLGNDIFAPVVECLQTKTRQP